MHQMAQALSATVQSPTDMPCGDSADPAVVACVEDRDLAQSASADTVAADMHEHLHGGGELTVQRTSVEPADRGKRFETGRHLGRAVGVHGPRAAVVTGVERGE